jgi:hypothetical protein
LLPQNQNAKLVHLPTALRQAAALLGSASSAALGLGTSTPRVALLLLLLLLLLETPVEPGANTGMFNAMRSLTAAAA